MPIILKRPRQHHFWTPSFYQFIQIVSVLIFATHSAASASISAVNLASVMKNQLPNTFADGQNYALVFIQIVNLKRNPIDISRINPASIKTHCHAVSPPRATTFHLSRAAMRPNSNKFMRVRQNSLTRLQNDNRMIWRNILKFPKTVPLTPFGVRNRLKWTLEVSIDIRLVKRIINSRNIVIFLFIKIKA